MSSYGVLLDEGKNMKGRKRKEQKREARRRI
jgi:hypothetical protein